MGFARFQILICEPQSIWCKLLVLSWLYNKGSWLLKLISLYQMSRKSVQKKHLGLLYLWSLQGRSSILCWLGSCLKHMVRHHCTVVDFNGFSSGEFTKARTSDYRLRWNVDFVNGPTEATPGISKVMKISLPNLNDMDFRS